MWFFGVTQVSDGLGKGVAVCVDVIGGGPRRMDKGGRQVRQFGEVTADVAAVGVDLVRTGGHSGRWPCLGRQGASWLG